MLPQATWQRCYVHFLRNARERVPRRARPTTKLRWLYDHRTAVQAMRRSGRPASRATPANTETSIGDSEGTRK